MWAINCRGAMWAAVALLSLAALVPAQITFSRDWSGGKRALLPGAGGAGGAPDCAQFAQLCRHFVHELKTALSMELTSGPKRRRGGDEPPLYDEDK